MVVILCIVQPVRMGGFHHLNRTFRQLSPRAGTRVSANQQKMVKS